MTHFTARFIKGSKGFTLIELLVVIAIIAILASILFPVFSKAREKARQSACQNNLREISVAFLQYSEDNDEHFPVGIAGTSGEGWAGTVYPYLKSTGMFKCMDDSTSQTSNTLTVVSYGYNSNLASVNGPGTENGLAILTSPAKTVLYFEITGINDVNLTAGGGLDTTSPDGNGYGVLETANVNAKMDTGYLLGMQNPADTSHVKDKEGRHTIGANYSCVDGHIIWARPSAISTGKTAASPACYTRTAGPASDTACVNGGVNNAAGTEVSNDPTQGNAPVKATFSPI